MIDDQEINEENDNVENLGIKAIYYNNQVDRYFTKYYIDQNTDKEQYIFIHTNGVIMCGLGNNHSIVKSDKKIKEVKDLNKLSKISGKRKHGAHIINENEHLLQIIMDDGQEIYNFSSKVKGKLIEINSNVLQDYEMLKLHPEKHGFLCFLLLSDLKSIEGLKQRLEKLNK